MDGGGEEGAVTGHRYTNERLVRDTWYQSTKRQRERGSPITEEATCSRCLPGSPDWMRTDLVP